jgi:hypothetical protein
MLKKGTKPGYSKRGTRTRVLTMGYSTRVAQERYLNTGTRQGVPDKKYSKRVLQRGYSTRGTQKAALKKGVLKKGYSKSGIHEYSTKETASGSCGSIAAGSARQCEAHSEQWPVWYGRMYRVLTEKAAPAGVFQGTHGVLTRCCAAPPSTRHSFVCLWQSGWGRSGPCTAVHGTRA